MKPVTIACVVEGHGEVEALPVLLRRMVAEMAPELHVQIPRPHRFNRSPLRGIGVIEDAVRTQAVNVRGAGGVLVLVDADDDCPAELGPMLQRQAQAIRPDIRVAVVLAYREFETWFLAASSSLGGRRGLPEGLAPPSDPERIRGAKEWLTKRMSSPYKETSDQARFAARFDLKAARQGAPSFDKLWREVERLVGAGRNADVEPEEDP